MVFADPAHELVVAYWGNGVPGNGLPGNELKSTRRFRRVTDAVYVDLGVGADA